MRFSSASFVGLKASETFCFSARKVLEVGRCKRDRALRDCLATGRIFLAVRKSNASLHSLDVSMSQEDRSFTIVLGVRHVKGIAYTFHIVVHEDILPDLAARITEMDWKYLRWTNGGKSASGS